LTAFTDSVDADEKYKKGICGVKRIVLAEQAPAYLSIEDNTDDPINGPSVLVYNDSLATESDVDKVTKINYRVEYKDQPRLRANFLEGSFDFTILSAEALVFDRGNNSGGGNAIELFSSIPLSERLQDGLPSVLDLVERQR